MNGINDVIQSTKSELKEIYEYRTILKSLVWKDLFGRYKNSYLGFVWHFFTPVLMMLVYWIGFTGVRASSMEHFWIFLASGLFPFTFLLANLTGGATYVTSSADMLKKMYFPRVIVVLSHVISSFVIMVIGYLVVAMAVVLFGHPINWVCMLLIPLFMVMALMFALGCALIVSSLTVYVRDLQYLLGSISMAFFFLTPMYFVAADATGILKTIVWLNPFTYYIESFHQLVYWGNVPDVTMFVGCLVLGIVVLMAGWFVFGMLKKGFVERL